MHLNERERREKGKKKKRVKEEVNTVLQVQKWDKFEVWSLFQNLVIKLHIFCVCVLSIIKHPSPLKHVFFKTTMIKKI